MESNLSDVFEQARQLVAEADRRVAETERRRREIEGQAKLAELVVRAEEAFDFTSREKLELDPRMDVHEDMAVIEFVVRAARAIFVLAPKDDVMWDLLVVEDGKNVSSVAEIVGGIKAEPNSRRLAAARVVASIAGWVEKHRQTRRAAHPQPQAQVQTQAPQAAYPVNEVANYTSQPVIDAAPAAQAFPAAAAAGQIEPALPAYEPRDRRMSDTAPAYTRPSDLRSNDLRSNDLRNSDPRQDESRYAEPARAAVQPAAVRPSQPAQKPATPARASYGTFGKFFGH